jgi:hypothetical protein
VLAPVTEPDVEQRRLAGYDIALGTGEAAAS